MPSKKKKFVPAEVVLDAVEDGAALGEEARLAVGVEADAVDARHREGEEGEDAHQHRAGDHELEKGKARTTGGGADARHGWSLPM